MSIPSPARRPRRPIRRPLARALALAALGLLCALTAPAAMAGAVPTLPGPPPGAGSGYPPAPPSGGTPAAEPVGPAASIPSRLAGPGLLGGTGVVHGRTLRLMVACQASGTATLSATAIQSRPLGRDHYRCTKGRGAVAFKLPASVPGRVRALHSTIGTIVLGRTSFSLTLSTRSVPDVFWSDGGLQCNFLGANQPFLVAPNFQVTPPAVIDVRPWVAFYTTSSGWQWLGTDGLERSTWYQWTASPGGVLQWFTPAGALNRWTWAPISVPSGHHIYAVGVFEVEYLYRHPTYVWEFAKSQSTGAATGTYCAYP